MSAANGVFLGAAGALQRVNRRRWTRRARYGGLTGTLFLLDSEGVELRARAGESLRLATRGRAESMALARGGEVLYLGAGGLLSRVVLPSEDLLQGAKATGASSEGGEVRLQPIDLRRLPQPDFTAAPGEAPAPEPFGRLRVANAGEGPLFHRATPFGLSYRVWDAQGRLIHAPPPAIVRLPHLLPPIRAALQQRRAGTRLHLKLEASELWAGHPARPQGSLTFELETAVAPRVATSPELLEAWRQRPGQRNAPGSNESLRNQR